MALLNPATVISTVVRERYAPAVPAWTLRAWADPSIAATTLDIEFYDAWTGRLIQWRGYMSDLEFHTSRAGVAATISAWLRDFRDATIALPM